MTPHDLTPGQLARLDALRAVYTDVTAGLSDINPGDVVYASTSGRFVKVRTVEVKLPDPRQAFVSRHWAITASDCDAAGKAIPMGDTHRITPPHTVTRQAQPGVLIGADLSLRLELERMNVAAMADIAGGMADQSAAGAGAGA